MIIAVIVSVWFLLWVYKELLPVGKNRHSREKAQQIKRMLFDLDFKRFKSLIIKEEFRKQYDESMNRLTTLQTTLKFRAEEKDSKDQKVVDEYKRLEDEETLLKRDIDRLKAQMDFIDAEIKGSNGTPENPEGVQGINQQLSALRELAEINQKYIKTL